MAIGPMKMLGVLCGRDRMRLACGAAAGVVMAGVVFVNGGQYLGGCMGYTQRCLDVGLTRGGVGVEWWLFGALGAADA